MATDIPDYSELDEVFELRLSKSDLPVFDLREDLSWKHRFRPFRRYTVRQFYFWHKTLYQRNDGFLMWLPELMRHDNQTEAVGRRYFIKACRITKRAANKLDYGPLIDENAQTIVVPETRLLRRTRVFFQKHWVTIIMAVIGTAIGVFFTIIYAT